MHTQSAPRVLAPHGLAFPVHELVFVRAWAQARGLVLHILLDQMLGGTACEEMLRLGGASSPCGTLSLWRMEGGLVVAQAEGGRPQVFGGIHSALSQAGVAFSAAPARAPSSWRRMLAWRRAREGSQLPGQGVHAMAAAFVRWGIV